MKRLIIALTVLVFASCKESPELSATNSKASVAKLQDDARGSVLLKIDGQTYNYDDIDWKYSRIEMNNGILIKVVQEELPSIDFGFPVSDPHFTNDSFNYTVGVNPRTETLYLSFFNKKRETKKVMHKRIVFRSGEIDAQRDKNSITINFEGQGSSMLTGSKKVVQFPISGTMKLKF